MKSENEKMQFTPIWLFLYMVNKSRLIIKSKFLSKVGGVLLICHSCELMLMVCSSLFDLYCIQVIKNEAEL